MKINAERLWERFHVLSDFGATKDHPELGITRYAFSTEYAKAAEMLRAYMEEIGMKTWIDAAGNIFGRLEGKKENAPCIMAGSHFDTVPSGGRYDGLAGVVAALEAVTCIKESGTEINYPIEIVAFANEEACQFKGGLMGSKAMTGILPLNHAAVTYDDRGNRLYDFMKEFGADPDNLQNAIRKKDEIMAFLELHIEQASLLEEKGLPVGIVTHIAGIHQLIINIYGQSAHAGGVPMEQRHDAMAAAVKIASEVDRLARQSGSNTRGTVGYIKSKPGVHNIIASEVEMPVDFREADPVVRNRIYKYFENYIAEICAEYGVSFKIKATLDMHPVKSNEKIMELYHKAAEKRKIPCMNIISYAAHDSMIMGEICPVGMIFLRSKDGLSHCPQEYTSKEDFVAGTEILLDTILACAVNGLKNS